MHKSTSRVNPRASAKSKLDYSARYGKNYARQCAIAWKHHKKLNNICLCCLKAKAEELHHTSYGGGKLSRLYDNWFPLCKSCHSSKAHDPKNWIVCHSNYVWGNRNTKEFRDRLLLGYKLLASK